LSSEALGRVIALASAWVMPRLGLSAIVGAPRPG
jgi:hypothetical protein